MFYVLLLSSYFSLAWSVSLYPSTFYGSSFFFSADDAQMLTTTKDHNEPLRKKEFLCLLQLGSKVSK